jgi:MFS family permease
LNKPTPALRLGLAANWRQFALLVAVNAFVGGMVGMERTTLPLLAEDEFGLTSTTLDISFIASFGLAKAIANLMAGQLASRYSRRAILIGGWLVGLPVPFLLIWAPAWEWVVLANALLGLNQGLAWSMTVNMKVDLAGPERRGLALGLNEAAGYIAVAAAAFASGLIAEQYGLRPEPFYLGIGFASAGLALSVLLVKDTEPFVRLEAGATREVDPRPLLESFKDGTWRSPNLVGLTQAGFVNNFNDGLAWGIFPLFFASQGLSIGTLGALTALYPLTWGVLQMLTGWASDVLGRLPLIAGGMLTQAGSLALIGMVDESWLWLIGLFGLGLGTAMVYPTLLAATSDAVHPMDRAGALGVFRFWRDVGAGAGALAAGIAADLLGLASAIELVALLTLLSALAAVVLLINPRHEPRLARRPV